MIVCAVFLKLMLVISFSRIEMITAKEIVSTIFVKEMIKVFRNACRNCLFPNIALKCLIPTNFGSFTPL